VKVKIDEADVLFDIFLYFQKFFTASCDCFYCWCFT